MEVLVIDHRSSRRRQTLAAEIARASGAHVSDCEQVWGNVAPNVVNWPHLKNLILETCRGSDLIVLHSGENQEYADQALKECFQSTAVLLYSGSGLTGSGEFEDIARSNPLHAWIPDRISLQLTSEELIQSAYWSRLVVYLKRIVSDPQGAKEAIIGFDPQLDGALEELVRMLVDQKGLDAIEQRRDALFLTDPWG